MVSKDSLRRERLSFGLTLYSLSRNVRDSDNREALESLARIMFDNVDGPPVSQEQIFSLVADTKRITNNEDLPPWVLRKIMDNVN